MSLKNTMTNCLLTAPGVAFTPWSCSLTLLAVQVKRERFKMTVSDFWRDFSVEFLAAILKAVGLRLMPR